MCRTTLEFVDRLRNEGYDVWTISLWEKWLGKTPDLDSAIAQIEHAFNDTRLGDGIGLREANAIDDYASDIERQIQRRFDEKQNWRNITSKTLNEYYVAPTFLDAKGFHFHLPAFLIADLNGEFHFGFTDRLIEKQPLSTKWIDLLDNAQANALIYTMSLLKHYPEYHDKLDAIDCAIARIRDHQSEIAG